MMKASLFVTCLVDQFFPQIGWAAVKILRHFDIDVSFDPRQTCCGQPAFNTGYQSEARRVAEGFVSVYADCERIVAPSGSCVAMIKHFIPQLFPEDSPLRRLALEIASRTWELSDFLVTELGVSGTGARFDATVTYHDSCHLLRELGVREQPRRLIESVEGTRLVEMPLSDRCCGFGGTFSVKFPEVSVSLGEDKIAAIAKSGADWVVACDASCLMHLDGILRRRRIAVRTLHLAELLAKF